MVCGERGGGGMMDKTSDWGKSALFKRRVDILRFLVVRECFSIPPPMASASASRQDQQICL